MKLERGEFQRSEARPALVLFGQGIRAEETRKKYGRMLRTLLCGMLEDILEGTFEERADQLVSRCRADPGWAVDLMLSMSGKLGERTRLPPGDPGYLNPSSFANYFKPVRKLLEMNGVVLPWARIQATYPEMGCASNTREWRRDEIRTLLEYAGGIVVRTIILVLASSGMRVGGLDLDWGDVAPVYRSESGRLNFEDGELVCAAVTVYRSSPERYTAFITPEAYYSLQKYRRHWTAAAGREPGPSDPLFRKRAPGVQRLGEAAIRRRLEKLVASAGLRMKVPGQRANEVPVCNGFRRFWNKTCKEISTGDSLSTLVRKEMMMGHAGLVKLDKNYFKTHVLEMAADYVKCVGALTMEGPGPAARAESGGGTDDRIEELARQVRMLMAERGR